MSIYTGRERVTRMLEGRNHDRVPRHDQFWPETILRWQGEGLVGGEDEVLKLLGNDLVRIGRSDPVPYPGQQKVIQAGINTAVVVNRFGATTRIWKNKTGTPEHLGYECTGPDVWRSSIRPRMEQVAQASPFMDIESARADNLRAHKTCLWTCFWCTETFEFAQRLVGFDRFLQAMAINAPSAEKAWIREISQFRTELLLRDFDAAIAAGVHPDGLWIFGDMAYKNGPLCARQVYRDIVWPDHKRLCDWAHKHEMRVIYHTDGDVRMVLDDLVDAGVDCLQPLEAKANMDVRQLAVSHGNELALFGNIDVRVLESGGHAAIEAEVESKLSAAKATRRYMYHSDHSIPPTVSWQTYLLLIALLDKYGEHP